MRRTRCTRRPPWRTPHRGWLSGRGASRGSPVPVSARDRVFDGLCDRASRGEGGPPYGRLRELLLERVPCGSALGTRGGDLVRDVAAGIALDLSDGLERIRGCAALRGDVDPCLRGGDLEEPSALLPAASETLEEFANAGVRRDRIRAPEERDPVALQLEDRRKRRLGKFVGGHNRPTRIQTRRGNPPGPYQDFSLDGGARAQMPQPNCFFALPGIISGVQGG